MYCENCGSFLPDGARFCGSCGSQVGASKAAAPAQPEEEMGSYLQTQGEALQAENAYEPKAEKTQPVQSSYSQPGQVQPTQQSSYAQSQPTQPSPYGQAQSIPSAQPQSSYAQPQPVYGQGAGTSYVQQQAQPSSKGKVPIVPIIIGIVAVVAIIIIVVMFVVKPGSEPAGSAGSSGSASSVASSVASSDQFVGDWKLSGFEASGITAVGNLSSILGFDGKLTLKNDGTGSLDVDGTVLGLKWEKSGDNAIDVTFDDDSAQGAFEGTITVSYDDGALDMTLESSGVTGMLIFSQDGKVPGAREISIDNAQKISSADVLNGTTWELTGVAKDGVSVYGDADMIASFMPSSMSNTNIKFKKDGTVKFMGEDLTWTITEKGNAVIKEGDTKVPVKQLGDDIVIDLSKAMGEDMVLLFSKAK